MAVAVESKFETREDLEARLEAKRALPGELIMARNIWGRLHERNKNYIGVLLGETASGKSWAALRLAELVDPSFTIKRNLTFDSEGFLDLVGGIPTRGTAIIWDEGGIGMSARRWQERLVQAVGYVMQSFRFLNLAVFVTVPDPSWVDRIARGLFHTWLEMKRVAEKEGVSYARPYNIQQNPRLRKTYSKHPIEDTARGPLKIRGLRIRAPTRKLTNAYEAAKYDYFTAFYRRLRRFRQDLDEERLAILGRMLAVPGLLQKDMAAILSVSERTIHRWKGKLEELQEEEELHRIRARDEFRALSHSAR